MEDEVEFNKQEKDIEVGSNEEIIDEKERKLVDLIIKMIVKLTLKEFYEKGN